MRLFISAGEASGDALGASLLFEIKKRILDVEAFGMGGPRMVELGFRKIRDSSEISVVGFAEVLGHLPRLYALNRELAQAAIDQKPDVAILIDVPDFNLRLAKRLRRAQIPVVFYVGPSVWAWRKWRTRSFARVVDRMLVLFPFEVDVWKKAGVDVVCVGHPLVDEIPAPLPQTSIDEKAAVLLPGSRRSEIARHLGPMLEAASLLKQRGLVERFLLPVAPGLDPRQLHRMIEAHQAAVLRDVPEPKIELVTQSSGDPRPRRHAIGQAAVALVASGTATLETALIGRPQVIVYRVSALTYAIARLLARVKHLGLVNLIAGREIAKELLQDGLTPNALAEAAARLLSDDRARQEALAAYDEVRNKIGAPGASARAAEAVISFVATRGGR